MQVLNPLSQHGDGSRGRVPNSRHPPSDGPCTMGRLTPTEGTHHSSSSSSFVIIVVHLGGGGGGGGGNHATSIAIQHRPFLALGHFNITDDTIIICIVVIVVIDFMAKVFVLVQRTVLLLRSVRSRFYPGVQSRRRLQRRRRRRTPLRV